MALRDRERILIERLKQAGRAINDDRLNAPFRLTIWPLTTVGTDWRFPVSGFDVEAFSLVKTSDFSSPIRGVMINPIIMDETLAKVPADSFRYDTRDRTIRVSRGIDHSKWSRADPSLKIDLFTNNLKSSIDRIPEKYLTASDRTHLLAIVNQVRMRLISRLVH
jgi:hypothetical protein